VSAPASGAVRRDPLRRRLGSPVLFGVVQAFIAAALYFSLGLVSDRTGGYTWLVYLAAAGFFLVTMLSYVEGASLHRERGGATVLARYAFDELWSFIAGWAVMLDYLIVIALSAFIATEYLGVFWDALHGGVAEVLATVLLIAAVAWINVRGIEPGRFDRIAYLALADLVLQVGLVVLGLAFLLDPEILTQPALGGPAPDLGDLLFGFTLAMVAAVGLDASSGFAGQVAIGRRGLRRLMGAGAVAPTWA
jgi:basic amino acid/polyamine antiporter, APA family